MNGFGFGLFIATAILVFLIQTGLEAINLTLPRHVDMILAGLILAALGFWLNHEKEKKPKFYKDANGSWALNQAKHELFFIPVQYWGLLLLSLGVIRVLPTNSL